MVEQEQREESRDLRLVGRGGQLPGQPDRLRGEIDIAAVPLVEHQVQHPKHGAQVSRTIQPDVAHSTFGPADPLGHRRFGHQVGLRDLTGGQAADGPQRQRDRRRGGQAGVRAQKVQPQRVIGGFGRSGRRRVGHPQLAVAPRGVGSGQIDEATPRRGDQPALRIVGALVGPCLDGPDQRLLHGVLGGGEVGPAVDEGRQDAGDQAPQRGLIHRVGGHYSLTVVAALRNGRTSSHSWIGLPPAPGAADNSPASSTAR